MAQQRLTNIGVIATNDDATECKAFAVEKGYWDDRHIKYFTSKTRFTKTPEINRGYYARVKSIEIIIEKLYQHYDGKLQVVNLGAGYDTIFWRLYDRGLTFSKFIEVDYQQVVEKKISIIKKSDALLQYISEYKIDCEQCNLRSPCYNILSGDITKCEELSASLSTCHLAVDVPTVFVTECVLVYIDTLLSNSLLSHISNDYKLAYFINYEQVNLQDTFGKVMIANLKQRNITLLGSDACKSMDTHKERFLSNGWKDATSKTMLHIYQSMPPTDLQRINKLEFLDEVELLDQLLDHYSITVASNHSSEIFNNLLCCY